MAMHKVFHNKGLQINSIIHLSPKEAYELLLQDAVAIDIREEYETEYKIPDVSQYVCIPNSIFKQNYQILSKTLPLIILDSVGLRSKESVQFLQSEGYDNVANLIGGIVDWEKDNLPLKIDKYAELSGSCACMLKPMKRITKKYKSTN